MRKHSLADFVGDLQVREGGESSDDQKLIVSFRLSPPVKKRYDRLQKRTKCAFGKNCKEAIEAMIEIAESKVG